MRWPLHPWCETRFYAAGETWSGICYRCEKLRYPVLPSAEIHILRIGKLQPDPYSSDDEDEYLSLDAPLDFTVSAARSNQNEGNEAPAKEPIKRILRKRIQRENNYAAPRTLDLGNGSQLIMRYHHQHHYNQHRCPFKSLVRKRPC